MQNPKFSNINSITHQKLNAKISKIWVKYHQGLIFFLLLILDLAVRLSVATHNSNWTSGDLLGPFMLVDQFFHQEPPNTFRQQWLLPMLISGLMKLLNTPDQFLAMLYTCNAVTAVTSSLVHIPIYIAARKLFGSKSAIWVTLLLFSNSLFLISSFYFNPTQTYTLFFTIAIVMMVFFEHHKDSDYFLPVLAIVIGLSYFIRHEGVILITTFACFIAWGFKTKKISRKQVIYSLFILMTLIISNQVFRLSFTNHPWAFMANTGAVNKPFSVLNFSLEHLFNLVITSFNFKLEKMVAFVVNLTFLGILFMPLGYYYLINHKTFDFFWIFLYWLIYEVVMFIYTLVLPVADNSYLITLHQFQPLPVPRYYQVFTPLLILFVYVGIQFSTGCIASGKKMRKMIVHGLLLAFMIHQLTLTYNFYKNHYASFNQGSEGDFIATAQFFRDHQIRNANILYYNNELSKYVYFSVISGGNTVNCWDANPDSSYDCFKKYPGIDNFETLLKSKKEAFDYIITISDQHVPPKNLIENFDIALEKGDFAIYKNNLPIPS
jgi:hypothetical protein